MHYGARMAWLNIDAIMSWNNEVAHPQMP